MGLAGGPLLEPLAQGDTGKPNRSVDRAIVSGATAFDWQDIISRLTVAASAAKVG
jgi:hypothetical protein